MKLVYVIRSAQSGGVESHVISLIEAFRATHDILLITLTRDQPNQAFVKLGVRILQLTDRAEQSPAAFASVLRLKRIFMTEAPDVVHLHGIRPVFIGGIAARLARVKNVVSTFHSSLALMSLDASGRSKPVKLFLSRAMHACGVVLSSHSVVVAGHIRTELLQVLKPISFLPSLPGTSRISVVYNGIDLSRFAGALPPPRPPSSPIIIGYVGRLDPKKGVDDLISAFARLRESHVDTELHIVGEGWDEPRLRAEASRLNVLSEVRFWGHQDDVISIARSFDVFVLPSLSEGMPLTIIEMMALAVPVIATKIGGIPEQIVDGENGVLVDVRRPEQIFKNLQRLIDEPQLARQMAGKGLERVHELFDSRTMLKRIEIIYSS